MATAADIVPMLSKHANLHHFVNRCGVFAGGMISSGDWYGFGCMEPESRCWRIRRNNSLCLKDAFSV